LTTIDTFFLLTDEFVEMFALFGDPVAIVEFVGVDVALCAAVGP
jgi:hypothetical protein